MNELKHLRTREEIEAGFDAAVAGLQFLDLHVHDQPWCMGSGLSLRGPDAAIAYHYLYGEVFGDLRLQPGQTDEFWSLPLEAQAEYLVDHSLADGSLPVSEARLGLLTAARALGLPTESGDFGRVLAEWRALHRDLGDKAYTERVFRTAGISRVISTQSPFVALDP